MYTPRHYAIEDLAVAHDVIRQNSFAVLISTLEGHLEATHVPVVLEAGDGLGMIRGHLARANPLWRSFDGETEALFIFAGQHGYISPAWYEPGPAVPTWDYVAVHASGQPRIVDEDSAVMRHLRELVAQYENGRDAPWSLDTQDPQFLANLSRAVACFEMRVERLEAKAKLGQNLPAQQARIADGLDTVGAHELARMIRAANGVVTPG